jgi:hypothetical protein
MFGQLNAEIDRLRLDLHKARSSFLEVKQQLADVEVLRTINKMLP